MAETVGLLVDSLMVVIDVPPKPCHCTSSYSTVAVAAVADATAAYGGAPGDDAEVGEDAAFGLFWNVN